MPIIGVNDNMPTIKSLDINFNLNFPISAPNIHSKAKG